MGSDIALSAAALSILLAGPAAGQTASDSDLCVDCLQVRVGPPVVVRGPFPDELDAAFVALKLPDGSFRGFSANGSTYAIDAEALADLSGPRREVLQAGPPGSINDCGRWLTSIVPQGDDILGFVHQERACDYDNGRTDKSMAIATSSDLGLSWTDLGTVITGQDSPQPGTFTGEGDCSLVDGFDGYLYAYCLRNSDWQTIVARAAPDSPTEWRKYHQGAWNEPGLGGAATDIGFIGTGTGYLQELDAVAAVTVDPWFAGLRLSLATDKVNFADLDEPLFPIDGAEWERPADTALVAYATILDRDDGSNVISGSFLLSYLYVPPAKGFESRYLVHHDVSLSAGDEPVAVQAGMALTRWSHPDRPGFITSTGPLTGERRAYRHDTHVAYMLTRAPDETSSVKVVECSSDVTGHLDQLLAEEGTCEAGGYDYERTAGWLFTTEQPNSVPIYRCYETENLTHFASSAADCEGLGTMEFLLGYGLES